MSERDKISEGSYAVAVLSDEGIDPGTLFRVVSGPEKGIYSCEDDKGNIRQIDSTRTYLCKTDVPVRGFAEKLSDVIKHPDNDLFFLDRQTGYLTELYFDRFADEGPCFVMNTLPIAYMRNAARKSKGKVSSFFMALENVAWQKFVPAQNTGMFDGCYRMYNTPSDFKGLTKNTMEGLVREGEEAYKREHSQEKGITR